MRILVQQVPRAQPPSFQVFCPPNDQPTCEPAQVISPASIPIEGRPNSDLLTELQWYLEHFLDYPFDPETDHADRIQEALKLWGESAFRELFRAGPACGLDDAQAKGSFANLYLQIASDDPDVLGWPWEALRDPERGILAHTCQIERRLRTVHTPPPLPTGLQMDCVNILLVVARPYENDVQYRSIARPLVQLIDRENLPARVEILRPPTLKQFQRHLAEKPGYYHLIHFDMHGAYGAGSAGKPEGSLIFEDERGEPDPIRASQISAMMREHAVPLVVLTACQSARIDASSSDPFSSVATALLGAGIRSVVAMAYSLYVSGAEQFLPAFYRCLFRTGSVSEAVRAGRQQMVAAPERVCARGTFPLQDWLLPVLYRQNSVAFAFADLARREPRVSKLPAELQQVDSPYGFVGRDSFLLALERAMRRPEAGILIQAMAGTGKTTLVKGLLQWLDDTDGLGNGAIWMSFQEIHSSEYVLNRLGDALIGGNFAAVPVEEKIKALADVLKKTSLLIVWDNFESASANLPQPDRQHLSELLNRLSGGATKVLITSRSTEDWLGRHLILQLEGLRNEERWELCNLIVRDLGIEINHNDHNFVQLMDLLDGHPLSMRIVLPRLARMTSQQVLEALRNNISDLGLSAGEAEDRLRATLLLLDETVPETLRPLLVPLAFFSRYVPLDLVATLVRKVGDATTASDIETLAAALVTTGVARPHRNSDLYKLHPLFTSYLRARIVPGESIPDAEVDKWAIPFVDEVSRYADTLWSKPFHQQEAPFQIMGLTFEYALELALRLKMNRHATALMQTLGSHAVNSGNFTEASRWFTDLATFSRDLNDLPQLATAYFHLAALAQRTDNLDEAEDYHKESLAIKESLGDRKRLATSYYQLGTVMNSKQDHEQAMNYFERALDAAIKEQFGELQSMTLSAMGQMAEQQYGDLDRADSCYREALKIYQESELTKNLADIYQRLASVARKKGNLQEAESHLFNGLAAAKTQRDPMTVAYLCRDLATVRAELGDIKRSRDLYIKALDTFEQIGDHDQARFVYRSLAELAVQSGDIALAERWLEKIRIGDERDGLSAYLQLIQFVINHDPLLADRWSRNALNIAAELEDAKGVSVAQQLLGVASEVRGDFTEAIEWYNATIKTRSGFDDKLGVASAQAQVAGALFGQGKLFEAAETLVEAMKVFQSARQVGLLIQAREQFQLIVQQASVPERERIATLWEQAGLN